MLSVDLLNLTLELNRMTWKIGCDAVRVALTKEGKSTMVVLSATKARGRDVYQYDKRWTALEITSLTPPVLSCALDHFCEAAKAELDRAMA